MFLPPYLLVDGHLETDAGIEEHAPKMQPALDNEEVGLMARVAAGDIVARRVLLDRFIRRIRGIAAAILSVDSDVDDAVQSTVIEVLASADGFRGENLPAWIDRIAVRTAMRCARERRLRIVRNAGEEPLLTLSQDQPEEPFGEALPRPLTEYLERLPPERRTTLVLRHAMDYSIAEIASVMEVSPNTVKDRLLAARDQIRKAVRRDIAIGRARGRTL
jgi:RNA polymerase sigma-70 factor, ECF subfamily